MTDIVTPLTPPRSDSPASPRLGTPEYVADVLALPQRRRIRSVLMRAGTSKGLFFRFDDLPKDREEWTSIILAAMGSPDPFQRQLDGLGGGQSTQSKVAVVGPSKDPRADVDYLFIQVPIDGKTLDFSGNCGNMASGVGPFAVDEGMVSVTGVGERKPNMMTVRIRNVNTDRIIESTFMVQDEVPVEYGTMQLDGISALGSPVRLDFLDPAGSMTGKLLPTGRSLETITLPPIMPLAPLRAFHVSCVDAANPFVFVSADEFGLTGEESITQLADQLASTLMEIRALAAVRMGMAGSVEEAALVGGTPKIAIVGIPRQYVTPTGRIIDPQDIDIYVRPFSMGKPHPSIQMTGAVCVGAASSIPGSLVHRILAESRIRSGRGMDEPVVIGHASGTMAVEGRATITPAGQVEVECGSVYRTARRLMEGQVLYQGVQSRPEPLKPSINGD